MIVITSLVVIAFFVSINSEMIPTSTSRVCEKYRNSQHARSSDWRYRLDGDGSYVPRNATPGLSFVNETECISECDSNDKCVSIAFREDGRCIQIAQCYLTDRARGYSYYVKESFNDGSNYTIDFGMECKQLAVQINTALIPASVPECWELCVAQEGCKFAEIDDSMECVLHSDCEYLYYHPNPDLRRGIIISGGPDGSSDNGGPVDESTRSPTQEPTPLIGTPSPSTGGDATTSAPTDPTDPTDTPTFPVHSHDDGHDDSGLTLGQKIGIGLGVTLVVLLIVLLLVWFFKS